MPLRVANGRVNARQSARVSARAVLPIPLSRLQSLETAVGFTSTAYRGLRVEANRLRAESSLRNRMTRSVFQDIDRDVSRLFGIVNELSQRINDLSSDLARLAGRLNSLSSG